MPSISSRALVPLLTGAALLQALPVVPAKLCAQASRDDLSPSSRIELHVSTSSVVPGEPFTAALRLVLDPGWHTYWVNGGDAGYPLVVAWDLPEGFEIGPLQWPAPRLQPTPPYMSYGYQDELVLLVEINPPAALTPGTEVHLRGVADWLVCSDLCLPAQGTVETSLPVGGAERRPSPRSAAIITRAKARLPRPERGVVVRAWSGAEGYTLEIVPPPGVELSAPYFFADDMAVLEHTKPQHVLQVRGVLRLGAPRSRFTGEPETALSGLLVADIADPETVAYQVSIPVGSAPEKLPPGEDPFLSPSAASTGGLVGSPALRPASKAKGRSRR